MAEVELPPLTTSQQQVSDHFFELIRNSIADNGAMPFSEYMQRSLYEPGLGYYVNGFSKLGKHGDFITAPEISDHFAACIARQWIQVFESTGTATILEFGGGSGRLACDVLKQLAQQDCLPQTYQILEISPDLQHAQRQLLSSELPADIFACVDWLSCLPAEINGLVLANEVLDAFAVERFKIIENRPCRMMVGLSDKGFNLHTQPDADVEAKVAAIEADSGTAFPEDYESEYCELLAPWLQSLAERMVTGAVVICDYGADRRQYYSLKKPTGTLRCFFRHRLHDDPFVRAPVQDITADVDFTAVAEAATDAGLELQGYAPLSEFMLSLGALEHHQQMLQGLDEKQQIAATGQLKRVIMSQEMGDRFMVIGFSRGIKMPLQGFSRADWSRLL